jgi:molybdopterin molybdotransferase
MAENMKIGSTATLNASPVSLIDALATLDRIAPVAPADLELNTATGFTLAADAKIDTTLRLTGARLRRLDVALLAAHGIARIAVRMPRLFITHAPSAESVATLIAGAIDAEGGVAKTSVANGSLETACKSPNVDAVIAIGSDPSGAVHLRELASIGQIAFSGVALSPGGTIVFGYVGLLPVLLLPGRMDSALAAWLLLGRRLLARLSFRLIEDQPFLLELARPLSSPRGVAEVIPVRRRAAQVEPLPGDAWSAQSIARADGWIVLPAGTDNIPAGTKVQMRPWP